MEGAEVGIVLAPQDAQCRRNGAPTGRQNDAGEQHQHMRPGRAREEIGEPREVAEKAWREWRTRRAGETAGMLHPTRRINAVNRSNLVAVRQIESVVLSLLADAPLIGHIDGMTKSDPTLALIAAQFTRHAVEKSGSGYTIVDRRTENPVARLRPIPDSDRFELLYWSNTKGRWTTFGNLGRMKLMLDSAHEIVENDPMFRIPRPR